MRVAEDNFWFITQNKSRMFRVQFSGSSREQALEHCHSCVQNLAQYITVQVPDGISQFRPSPGQGKGCVQSILPQYGVSTQAGGWETWEGNALWGPKPQWDLPSPPHCSLKISKVDWLTCIDIHIVMVLVSGIQYSDLIFLYITKWSQHRYHLSPHKSIAVLLTIFPVLYIISLWLICF